MGPENIKKKNINKSILLSKTPKAQTKTEDEKNKETEMTEYKRLLDRVTNKIDIWHKSITEKKKGKFKHDEDFIDLQPSPTKFHSKCSSSSDDECSISKDSTN